ncbi:prepilin-type N-terminal cleavage/methylation domain-containing protein [Geoalkalibacter subterraneus]|uniref:Prepilin-type N-terminal cleavage/methylation domain-containing protein n=1 Tax=Geoalkalibacter subterraneus TaxID=483547 RepID=A0A0B5FVA1_9BACT|nr:prepilin-type N-terminal cleavage/methylation domain-containing protein [Geoalkalibacter subterraneus]AJF08110.1 hypothetical protein GSUB_16495 [Geoalkalibacter subterraneus]
MLKFKKSEKGFTLIEMVIAAVLVLMAGAVVTPMLLGYVDDQKVASLNETLINTRAAFEAFYTDNLGVLAEPVDGDYFPDLVDAGFMSRVPQTEGVEYEINLDDSTTNSGTAFFVKGTFAPNDAQVIDRLTRLDERIDGDSGESAGILQWDATTGYFAYLLYGTGVDLNTSAWHSNI